MHDVIALDKIIDVKQITQDMNGNVYFCTTDGIYMEDRPFARVRKVASIKIATGMTFINTIERNAQSFQLIYSSKNKIYKLIPSRYSNLCLEALVDLSQDPGRSGDSQGVTVNVNVHF